MRHPRHTIHPMMATPDAVSIHATCRADTRRSRAGLARAPTNALAVRGRSAGDFARPAAIARSRGTGSAGRTVRIGRGGSLITRAAIACALGPVNGGSPASISYSTAARENTSLRGSIRRSEEHTSELQSLAYLVCRLLLVKKNQVESRV